MRGVQGRSEYLVRNIIYYYDKSVLNCWEVGKERCYTCISYIGSKVWLESGTLIFTRLVDVW